MEEEDFRTAMARSRARARREKPVVLVPTSPGIEEVRRVVAAAAGHASPEAALVWSMVERYLAAEAAKVTSTRAAARADVARWVFGQHYSPTGFSVRRAAEDIASRAKTLASQSGEHPPLLEPDRSVWRILSFNGGKPPSLGTIRKDLEGVDLS